MNLGQQQLRMRKVRRIDLDCAGWIFLREIEMAQLEISDAEGGLNIFSRLRILARLARESPIPVLRLNSAV